MRFFILLCLLGALCYFLKPQINVNTVKTHYDKVKCAVEHFINQAFDEKNDADGGKTNEVDENINDNNENTFAAKTVNDVSVADNYSTIILKNGQSIKGMILKKTDREVDVRVEGGTIVLYTEEISDIKE